MYAIVFTRMENIICHVFISFFTQIVVEVFLAIASLKLFFPLAEFKGSGNIQPNKRINGVQIFIFQVIDQLSHA